MWTLDFEALDLLFEDVFPSNRNLKKVPKLPLSYHWSNPITYFQTLEVCTLPKKSIELFPPDGTTNSTSSWTIN